MSISVKCRMAAWLLSGITLAVCAGFAAETLESGFRTPPPEARLRCYWWWLNGNVTKASISRDLAEMKAKGYGGAILIDAGGAAHLGNRQVPVGPLFGSPAWRELYRHTLSEATRNGIELSLNVLSGWNLGGPTVKAPDAAKLVTWATVKTHGPLRFSQALPVPEHRSDFYRDIAVMAWPARTLLTDRKPLRDLKLKGVFAEAGGSTPETAHLLFDEPSVPGEEDFAARQVVDLGASMDSAGKLTWDVPAGEWEIMRFGYTVADKAKVKTSSGDWKGMAIDYLDSGAFETYWGDVLQPLIDDSRPFIGRSLKYLVSDSWELGGVNWTPAMREEFRARRGYDPLPYLPVLAGRIVESRDISTRFLNDLRKTIGDLIADNHYQWFADKARHDGLGTHPEAGGPHGAPVDALKALGRTSFPQMEYWAFAPSHRVRPEERFFTKEAASAAHIYGKNLVSAEGMTTIGLHWEESLWSNLKPNFDRALCEGLNLLIWHTFTSSPAEMGRPGQEYFAGTHLNPNVTWWEQSPPFLAYLNRGTFMLQRGQFVADVLYYYGDHVPNFVRLKTSDPARVLPGYDYDVTNEEVLLDRITFRDGRLWLPDGMSYRVLVLPDLPVISLRALRKVKELVEAGAIVVGRKPERTASLEGFPQADQEVARLADELWGRCCKGTAREALEAAGVKPDFDAPSLDYIHRRDGEADIYFVSNQREQAQTVEATFRVANKAPEFWNPETGEIEQAGAWDATADGRTRLTLRLRPYGSMFVVFRKNAGEHIVAAPPAVELFARDRQFMLRTAEPGTYNLKTSSGRTLRATVTPLPEAVTLAGPWTVRFANPATFETLHSWTEHSDPAVKYFAGTAAYEKEIEIPAGMLAPGRELELDLGEVREIARVKLNGTDLGIRWSAPFTADLTRAAKPGRNKLEIQITNLWPNRLIGDQKLPESQRQTRTNITKFTADSPLLPSGLLGPVTLRPRAAVALR